MNSQISPIWWYFCFHVFMLAQLNFYSSSNFNIFVLCLMFGFKSFQLWKLVHKHQEICSLIQFRSEFNVSHSNSFTAADIIFCFIMQTRSRCNFLKKSNQSSKWQRNVVCSAEMWSVIFLKITRLLQKSGNIESKSSQPANSQLSLAC